MKEVAIITEKEIKDKICNCLRQQDEHIILEHMQYEYFNDFWENISLLYQGGILSTAKSVKKICNKLQLNGSYDRNKCFQGISEIIFCLYAIRMEYDFDIDKKLHTGSENNNSDVDIQIIKNGHKFNIEVKTPDQINETEDSLLRIISPCRISSNKYIRDKQDEKNKKFAQALIDISGGKYTDYKQEKIDDNKLIEYLRSGQNKFTYAPDSINVLAVSVSSEQIGNYWQYLYNSFSGIFTDKIANIFRDKNEKETKHSDFDKVDVVYLTNIVEGHKRCLIDFDSWKLENYCSIFCVNPFRQSVGRFSDIEILSELKKILPNDNDRFNKECEIRKRQLEAMGLSVDPTFFLEYLRKYYYKLK